jgi:hypothetical protein
MDILILFGSFLSSLHSFYFWCGYYGKVLFGEWSYNPHIIRKGKDHQNFVSLATSVLKKDSVIAKLQYLHSLETKDDNLLAINLTSKRGLKFLRHGLQYLMDETKRVSC